MTFLILCLCFLQDAQPVQTGSQQFTVNLFKELREDRKQRRQDWLDFRAEARRERIADRKERRKWLSEALGTFLKAAVDAAPLKTLVSGIRYLAWIMGAALAFYVLVRIRTAYETLSRGAGLVASIIPKRKTQ